MTDLRWLHDLMTRCRSRRILVVGDLMLDEFIWGKVSRISPEAPVPIVEVSDQSYYPGGAANVARNLREFTRGVAVMGVVGSDSQAEHLCGLLTADGIDVGAIQQLPAYRTIVKTRIIARQQHVVRVDRESPVRPDPACHTVAVEQFRRMLGEIDAVIIEDYAKGFLNQEFVDEITALARNAGKIVTVDPNPRNDLRWNGVTAIKPNRAEAFHAAGLPLADPSGPPGEDTALLAAGERLLRKWDTQMLLITLGELGMLLLQRDEPPRILAPCAREVFDLSGAGDTAIALFTLALSAGCPAEQAAEVANHAAGVVVGKLGTAILTPDELIASFEQVSH
jgi:D-beta-D-heptose 7-phosphate kinase/D-beta-D-heptose 1-phosphate adenosyltransferase